MQGITITQPKTYNIFKKVLCCKCFNCFKQVIYITTDMRNQSIQKLINEYTGSIEEEDLYDPIMLMVLIYLCKQESVPLKHIDRCKLSPNVGIDSYRTDLQFYIPQLSNYLVFGCQFSKAGLLACMEAASKINFYFGHLYYFYIATLEKTVTNYEIKAYKKVSNYKMEFLNKMCNETKDRSLNAVEYYASIDLPSQNTVSGEYKELIKDYGTNKSQILYPMQVTVEKIYLPNYSSVFSNDSQTQSFKSTINFFQDLFNISEDLKNYSNKKQKLIQHILEINRKLPASIYIPFSKIRLCNILNIVPNQCRVFSTKQRAPFYLCIQVYCPSQILNLNENNKFWENIEVPQTIREMAFRQTLRRSSVRNSNNSNKPQAIMRNPYSQSIQPQQSRGSRFTTQLTKKLMEESQQHQFISTASQKQYLEMKKKKYNLKNQLQSIFGQSQSQNLDRIRLHSIYGSLNTWSLIHIIVKTGDNLKQQQFALQLIYQFDYIFKLQKLQLQLTPYQVISMGADCGIIEMVRQTVTIDKLKKQLNIHLPHSPNLKQFFQLVYHDNLHQAKLNFVKSLAAYSLVMYVMQAKDRHNGNILLHRSGKIIHIDFGFFLSNMPGKGIQLQKNIPFKLLTQYLNVLDGQDSYYFQKFRKYFFLGMKAIRKHQNIILILVKMMYSSSGVTMPCFQKGQEAIQALQKRINPPDVNRDSQLNIHCQRLINLSLDNSASKWYDRWQYFAQGIFY